jgi:uroporphyrinogen decarboxylase
VIGLDWRIRLDAARARLGPRIILQGNLDPAVLLGPPDTIRRAVESILRLGNREVARAAYDADAAPAGRHIFNLGHGILPHTPPDHARLVVEIVRELSARPA